MNPVSYALSAVRHHIPKEILETVFKPNQRYRTITPDSIDAAIRSKVLDGRVFIDCNLVGGTETRIPLRVDMREMIDPYTAVYRIPKSMTQGRTITRALEIGYSAGASVGQISSGVTQSSSIMDAAAGLLASQNPIPLVSTCDVQLVGENVVMVIDNVQLPTLLFLRCWLENDTHFNHIQPTSYRAFSDLVIAAVRAYIYVNAQIPMDKAYIHAGAELGKFAEFVDSCSDANEKYEELLDRWAKIALMNDFESHRRHIKLEMGGLW